MTASVTSHLTFRGPAILSPNGELLLELQQLTLPSSISGALRLTPRPKRWFNLTAHGDGYCTFEPWLYRLTPIAQKPHYLSSFVI